ncbi:MAG TPA: hypothetical protein VMA75_01550 [Candidatus Paceibacterota bacterium]|nr:hypothetical protein [Candidatus Paceibacterota bacterium]
MKKLLTEANLPVIFFKERGQFVAYTPALDLSTAGKTLGQAEKHFKEAVGLFFEECHKMGTLDAVLRDLGWEKSRTGWVSPVAVVQGSRTISVPLPA